MVAPRPLLVSLVLMALTASGPQLLLAQPPLACELDDLLSESASELLLLGGTPTAAQLTAAVRAAGSDAVALHALLTRGPAAAAREAWLTELRSHADAALRCGAAESEQASLLIATAQGGSLAPIDPNRRRVRGSLAAGFARAELVLSDAHGTLQRLGVSSDDLARGVVLGPELELPLEVQLVAHGAAGPRPVAARTVELASAGAVKLAPVPDAPKPAAISGERATATPLPTESLNTLLVQLRRAHDRLPLRDNRLLRQAAQGHARAVCAQGRIAHELDGRDPEARVEAQGLHARLVGEVIARAADVPAALDALLASPSHRLTLLEPRFTDVGVGEASDRNGKRCFVVLLCAWPHYVGRGLGARSESGSELREPR